MANVTLSHVFKRFGAASAPVVAVKDLSLEIHDKEFMVLVGPSGCGKTTALRMIAGLEEISDGEIIIDRRVVNNVEPRDRDIAMVFQNYALYPHMSVFENMAFGLRLRKVAKSEIDKRVRDTAELLGLTALLTRKPGELSGGQRQRVALGRAIVREPKVFLMDEPLSNLDAKLRIQTRAELTKLHRRLGITTIYVTHDQVEAMTMGDRMAVMKDGVLQQCDTPMNVYNKPANMFVAGFVGTPSMNFLQATLRKDGDKFVASVADGFAVPIPANGAGPTLANYADKKVVLGIRPADIYDKSLVDPNSPLGKNAVVRTQVEVVEPMGDVSTVYLTAAGNTQQLIATLDAASTAKDGNSLDIAVDCEKVHVFDSESEIAIV
jgi:multiple sugar transport system ATP-binding protein